MPSACTCVTLLYVMCARVVSTHVACVLCIMCSMCVHISFVICLLLYMISILYKCVCVCVYIYIYIYTYINVVFYFMICSFANVDYIAGWHTHVVKYKYIYMCVCMYFEVLMITTDIHCHSHRSYVSCWFVVRLLVRLHSRRDVLLRTPCAGWQSHLLRQSFPSDCDWSHSPR